MTKLIRTVPAYIKKPPYTKKNKKPRRDRRNHLNKPEMNRLRRTGKIAREILNETLAAVKPGVSTAELDEIAFQACLRNKVYPSPLGYDGYTKSICTSINNVVCHGIPSETDILQEGDIINCDITIYSEGVHGDCSETVAVGKISEEARNLIDITRGAMNVGIEAVRSGSCVTEIGKAIQNFLNDTTYTIVRDFSGHGIGKGFHIPPNIYHFENRKFRYPLLPGTAITIEPMINIGYKDVKILKDGWTAVTKDGSLSAQFEQTLLITEEAVEIVTA